MRRNKYFSREVTVDGKHFDSKKEARRYQELCLLERAGAIHNLQTQVKYVLIPAQREPDTVGKRGGIHRGKVIEREVSYIADFVYWDIKSDQMVVEDVKGYKDSTAYAVFALKRKLMLFMHGIRVKEI